MAYVVTLTDGTILTTISNSTVDYSTSLTLIGKDYSGYGGYIAEDLVHLLENSAYIEPPAFPLVGQLWYDTSVSSMKVWNGTVWVPIGGVQVGPMGPTGPTGPTGSVGPAGTGGVIPEVANEGALPSASSVTSPVYYVDNYIALNGLPALASRLSGSWFYYPSKMTTYYVDTGTTNNIVVAASPAPSSLNAMIGVPFVVKMTHQNTGNVTLKLNTFAIKPVLDPDGQQIGPLKLSNNGLYEVVYDGTNFQLVSATSPASVRIRITGPFNLYVATTGSDSNDGLTVGTPFLTLQKAWNYVLANIDINGQAVNINVAAGTYTAASTVYPLAISGNAVGGGQSSINFIGQISNPASCVIAGVNASAVVIGANIQTNFRGFTVTATGTASGQGSGFFIATNSYCVITNCIFSTCDTTHVYGIVNCQVVMIGPYYISGNCGRHIMAQLSSTFTMIGQCIILNPISVAQQFLLATESGVIEYQPGMNYVNAGIVSGLKWFAQFAGGIVTQAASGSIDSFVPGTVAGVAGVLGWTSSV